MARVALKCHPTWLANCEGLRMWIRTRLCHAKARCTRLYHGHRFELGPYRKPPRTARMGGLLSSSMSR